MKKTRSTKRALLMSGLALFACISMLVGSTFAWFTDSVVSANNIIKSGNLDIELYYQVEGKSDWAKVDENTNVFMKDALWEPGHTEVVKLKVVNEGSLALKYQLGVNIASEIGSVNVYGKDFLLSDYIKYGVVEGDQDYTREQAVSAVDATANCLKTAYASETVALEPKAEKIVTMVVYMPTSVDNKANYAKGEDVPTINLGINLFATQYTSESDSFGKDYDEDAWVKVYSAEDLIIALANGDGEIILEKDITSDIIDITKDVSIDLNGNELTSNLAIAEGTNVVVSNGTIVNYNSEESAIETVGNLTLDNVVVESTRHGVRVEGGKTVINGGTYKTVEYAGRTQHALNVSDGGVVEVYGGTFVGPKGTASDSGSAVKVQSGSTVTIFGGDFSGGKNHTLSADGTLIVKGGSFDQDPSAYVADGFKAIEKDGTWTVAAFTKVSTPADLEKEIGKGNNIELTGDITLTKNLQLNKGKDVVIDLNGNNITAPSSNRVLLSYGNVIITSSVPGAEINVSGGDASVLLGYGSTEIKNVTINVTGCDNYSPNPFSVYGDLILGEGTVVNVDYLGTSLINNSGKANIVIDGAEINVGTFRTNAGAVISLTKGTTVALNDTVVNIGLDTTYTSYFIKSIKKADDVTIEGCTFTVTGTDGNSYDIEYKADASVGDKYVWVKK